MRYTQLGNSGIEVSCIGLGCWGLIGGLNWGDQDEPTSIATVHAALDAGITFFDTAEGYGDGHSEQLLGRALAGRRQRVIIATKVNADHLSATALREACDRSLESLRTDYIDLYQIHWPSRTVQLSDTWSALESLRNEGKVRAIGVSNFGIGDLADLLVLGRPATNQLPYSLLGRAIEFEILPKCAAAGVGVLCYSPLAQGLLAGRFAAPGDVPDGRARTRHFSGARPYARHGEPGCETETFEAIDRVRAISRSIDQPMSNVSLAWLTQQPGICSVIAGARNPAQIRQTARAGELVLESEVVSDLTQATQDVQRLLGPNPDLWQSTTRYS